jgi:toxin ParE1/3/4
MAARLLEIHPAALEELKSATLWYMERSETAARNFVAEIDRAVSLVTESPQRWPARPHGTRTFVLKRYPFSVVYRTFDSAVQILAIAHGHRRPGYWQHRL